MAYAYFDCRWRHPCPICKRCMNYAPHRYARCRTCAEGFRPCKHSEEVRARIIRRRNFRLTLPHPIQEELDAVLRMKGGGHDGQA